ncbi:LysR family transcriptional regulator [Streptomyces poonensis]|uniref:LysR family transcriptional regulator n=1 Tax=Streptomyces poonensis TaxID=68255 RepID=A0A918UEU2_9ACTN|nr:LysR substrate-binding domain-containing protein [Streptomyces poonensis]GGY98910.1 LysR family transcriptional regulator [Streptomyces poonensis]
MDLRQLQYFVAVAEEASFTRAAGRVNISQSGVSAQIRQLERELGAELFDRSARTVTLTAAGRAALGHARAALAAAHGVGQAVGEVTGLLRGRLTVGMVIGCTLTALFDALAAFHAAHPGVEISLLEDHSDRLVEAVRAGTVDLAVAGTTSTAALDGLDTLTVISERLAVAVPPGHPLAAADRVALRDVTRHPIVCMPPGTGLRTLLDEACAAQRLQPAITLQASAADAVADLAARGLAVAVLSESMALAHRDRLTTRLIEDVTEPALLSLLWRNTPHPAVHALLVHSRHAFTAPAAGPAATAGREGALRPRTTTTAASG